MTSVARLQEDRVSAGIHVIGLGIALVGGAWLLSRAEPGLETRIVLGFAGAWIVLYLASILYHSVAEGLAKKLFSAFDRGAIFILIAASYTPLVLLPSLPGGIGVLLALVWIPAGIGVGGEIATLFAADGKRFERLSMVLYLAQGWLPALIMRGPSSSWHRGPSPGAWSEAPSCTASDSSSTGAARSLGTTRSGTPPSSLGASSISAAWARC